MGRIDVRRCAGSGALRSIFHGRCAATSSNEACSVMPSSPKSGAVYLIDAHSLIFQVFHAIPNMTSPTGLPTNAVFGFVRDLMFLRRKKPDYLVCAFDRAEPTFRSDLYPDYKAHRDPVPDDLVCPAAAHRAGRRGAEHPRRQPPEVRGRRRAGHPGAGGVEARPRRLPLHQRQGLPPAHRRPHPPLQPAQASGVRPGRIAGRLGRDAGAGGGPANAGRRLGGQRAGRARHRRQDGGQALAGVRHARQPAGQRR